MFRHFAAGLLLFSLQPASTPASAVEQLLQTDRGFSASGSQRDTIAALSAMFADDVTAGLPDGSFASGKARLIEALKSNPDNAASRIAWTPIRGGISADGLHGFTFGYMTALKPDGTTTPMKYLAYWVKGSEGWRVVAYRRRPSPAGNPPLALLPPSLPARLVQPSDDASLIERHRRSLADAEQAFSDEAQKVGLAAAFTAFGRADAVNLGSANDVEFVVGSAAIGRSVGAGTPTDSSPVVWSADHKVMVASSGDLGVTFGFIRSTTAAQQPPIPFFTVWRRDSPDESWRYIAE